MNVPELLKLVENTSTDLASWSKVLTGIATNLDAENAGDRLDLESVQAALFLAGERLQQAANEIDQAVDPG